MLPKVNRLRKTQEFASVYKGGTRQSTFHLTLRALRSHPRDSVETQPTRLGITVSQKVSKRAVVRNRIKRQLRAICRQLLPKLLPGWSVVIVARGSVLECDYPQFLRELEQLLTEAGILNGN